MPRISKNTREEIKRLNHNDLVNIVLKLAAKDKLAFDFIMVNYLDKQSGEKQLFEDTLTDLDNIYSIRHKGFSEELRLANILAASIRRVNEFTKISNNKILEANLLMYILNIPFSLSSDFFGTCFTSYDTKVAIILKRVINVVSKLHEDYKIDYEEKINKYLKSLHQTSEHINTVYNLPHAI